MKYLKHINIAITTYSSGRTDFVSITAKPGEIHLYDNVIIEDNMSVNYNAHIWDDYIKNNYWTVIEVPALVIIIQPQNVTMANRYANSGTATFTVVASGPGTLTYKWYKNGNHVLATTDTLVLSTTGDCSMVPGNNGDTVYVIVSNGSETIQSQFAILDILSSS